MGTIRATRDSVCMGDDCDAPHFESFSYTREEMLSGFLTKLYRYVARIGGKTVRWTVYINGSSYDMNSERSSRQRRSTYPAMAQADQNCLFRIRRWKALRQRGCIVSMVDYIVGENKRMDIIKKNTWIPTLQGIIVTAIFLATEIILQKLGAFNGAIRRYSVDIALRFLFGAIAFFLIYRCYEKERSEYRLGEYFTNKIPKVTWLYLIPFVAYLIIQLSFIFFANEVVSNVTGMFALDALQQVGSGFFEEACRVLIICGLLKYCSDTKKSRVCTILIVGLIFGLSHGLNFFFGQGISSTLWQVGNSFIWGSFMAAVFMLSRNIALLIILHTVWDIVIRIPTTFMGFPEENWGLSVLDFGGYVLCYMAMLIVALYIAITYDKRV